MTYKPDLKNPRPKEVFFYDPEDIHPVAYVDNSGNIHYNLSTMPDRVKAWVDLISHEWLAWLITSLGFREEEWVVEQVLEWAGVADTFWGGVIAAV